MVYSFDNLQKQVEEAISSNILDQYPEPDELYAPLRYSLKSGGKRLRPVLLLMAYNLYHDDIKQAIHASVALEVFHNFTLLHDDIMDESPVRRNKPTVHEKWDANTAILSGDAMMIKAYRLLTDHVPVALRQVLKVFNRLAMDVCEGQQYDMNYETRQYVQTEEYLHMITLKTSVLIAGAMKIGALIAGADDDEADTLYAFGLNLGLAFQLQDDMLDTFGNKATFGKRIGGDIAANKKTYLLIKALELANEKQFQELNNWFGAKGNDPESKIAEVTAIYQQLGIKAITQDQIGAYYKKAQEKLDQLNVPAERKAALKEVAEMLLLRVY